MLLTQKLLGFLNRVFKKDPAPFVALSMSYAGTDMNWAVSDGVLTINAVGGPAPGQTVITLADYTLTTLAAHIATLTGFTVTGGASGSLAATVLIDASGDQAQSNGGVLFGYTDLAWSILDANAVELNTAQQQAAALSEEMNTQTADGYWLDYVGGIYGIPRSTIVSGGVTVPEPDPIYGPRIIQTVIQPKGNNIALAMAINTACGGISQSTVTDVGSAGYCLFDVEYPFNLEGSEDVDSFAARVLQTIEVFRDAGTHVRNVALQASTLGDTVAAATDTFTGTVFLSNPFYFNGVRQFNGADLFDGSYITTSAL